MIIQIEKNGDEDIKITLDPVETTTEITDIDSLEITSDTT